MIGLPAKSSSQQGLGSEVDLEGMDSPLGDIMRGERATMGKSLLDVQRELRIRASYIAAIENCDVSAFDAPSFISGYVRSYARYLKMDPDWVFRRFCAESGFSPTHGMAPAASGPKPQRRPSDPAEALANPRALFIPQPESFWSSVEPRAIGSLVVLIALVTGLGYGGWSVLQELQKVNLTPGDQIPGVTAALDPAEATSQPILEEGEDLALNLPQPEGIDRIYRPQVLEVPVLTARDGPIASIDPELPPAPPGTLIAAQDAPAGGVPPVAVEGAGRVLARSTDYGPQLPADQMAVRTVALDAPELELLAVRPAWVRVTSADGTVLLEKTMDAGERFALPKLESPPVLRAGNSGAIYFAVNGRTYGPAAPGAQVVKNVELSPASLTARYVFADLSKDEDLKKMVAMASADPALIQGDAADSQPVPLGQQ
ncbi:helix-turn-helix domain-containing protein [uncultured Paracoccus sp.]|uniref:helix-turn-helix domain-containing protein n=2 Tax=Paracoccus TaxID=265 RepID=UPI00351A90A4